MTISDEDLKRLDDRYVTKTECEVKQDKVQADIASMRADMAALCSKQDTANTWLRVIGGAIITGLIGAAFALIKFIVLGG